jgi:hypothetical protein
MGEARHHDEQLVPLGHAASNRTGSASLALPSRSACTPGTARTESGTPFGVYVGSRLTPQQRRQDYAGCSRPTGVRRT